MDGVFLLFEDFFLKPAHARKTVSTTALSMRSSSRNSLKTECVKNSNVVLEDNVLLNTKNTRAKN